ncbi:MAG TPA: PDZ domain-containing protein [Phnomibacter sp.]|nr:PDZ domain-containing protein [Phnomibacter sp.]
MKPYVKQFAWMAIGLLAVQHVFAIDTNNTRLLWQPAISKTHIAFIYAEDLWVANLDGSNPRRITVSEGRESNPIFSPDGSSIAFTGQYDGNSDVFIVPTAGGIPKRLTWHPGADNVRDFSPDGKKILFASARNVFTGRYTQLFTVDINTGSEEQLPIPNANWASYSPDGSQIAYTPLSDVFEQWKNYRGGTISRIWLYDVKSHAVVEIPKPAGGCNDTRPVWKGNTVYFRSDRNGEFNLYGYDPASKAVSQLSKYNDFPVSSLNGYGNDVIFSQAGYLFLYNGSSKNISPIKVGIGADLIDLRQRYVKGDAHLRSGNISPSGARVVVDYRGEVFTLPAQKGDPVNLTNSSGAHEKYPAWSPDGKSIAYFSDVSGEYALHIKNQDNTGAAKVFALNGSGFYFNIHWSPDSKKICYVDNGRCLYVLDIASGKSTKIAEDVVYSPGSYRDLFGSWSSDASCLAYTIITETNFERAYIYSFAEGKSHAVSDGLSNVTQPVFDPSGKYLYMLVSTDAGPLVNWFDLSNQDMTTTNLIYLVTLQKNVKSPFAKENDVEEVKEGAAKGDSAKPATKPDTAKSTAAKPSLKIDWEGLENRIVPLPISKGNYGSLSVAKEGELYYLSAALFGDGPAMLNNYSLKKHKEEPITPADDFMIAARGEKMLIALRGRFMIVATGQKPGPDAAVNTSALQVKISPADEWKNIFAEAWRVNRDYFYDPNFQGANWEAMKKKYEVLLPDVACVSDLYQVMQWMFSELAVGHQRFTAIGDRRINPEAIAGGLLGADIEVKDSKYSIKKIYGGLNWSPDLRSPLTEPGVDVKAGDYILAVNGEELNTSRNFYSYFENTAGKLVELKVSANANGSNARTVKVVPIANEAALRNRDWVEGNMRKVHAATDGRVAYVYVPNTSTLGHEYFKRYFFPQANKEAIIVDERFNGGGQLADYYIDMLKKPVQSYWSYRYGKDQKAPSASIQGPKVMLIDETAGSGGDYLPYLFRQAKLGTLVGKRTWGGLVGILGFPEFIDGGSVTAPNVAFYDENGFGIENVGTPPDVEVEQWPKDVINGKDPQLEKAIEIILKELKANPPKQVKKPAYPIRVKK